MAGVNKVIILGRLGRDPEVKNFQNGGRICNLSMATSETWKDKNSGERKERAEWHSVVISNDALIGIAEKYLKKGDEVYIEGQLQTRKYEKDGVTHYTTEIHVKPYTGVLTLVGGRKSGGDGGGAREHENANGYQPQGNDLDDEIPF